MIRSFLAFWSFSLTRRHRERELFIRNRERKNTPERGERHSVRHPATWSMAFRARREDHGTASIPGAFSVSAPTDRSSTGWSFHKKVSELASFIFEVWFVHPGATPYEHRLRSTDPDEKTRHQSRELPDG